MWYIDASRYKLGVQDCEARRFYQYHDGGYGFETESKSVHLWVGITFHAIVESFLTNKKNEILASIPQIEAAKGGAWAQGFASSMDVVLMHHLGTRDDEESLLVRAMAWVWLCRTLPWVLTKCPSPVKDYKVEPELIYVIGCTCRNPDALVDHGDKCSGIGIMSRPDLITYHYCPSPSNGQYRIIHDWKSTSMMSDSWALAWNHSIQMAFAYYASGGIYRYYIHGVFKGRYDKNQGIFKHAMLGSAVKRNTPGMIMDSVLNAPPERLSPWTASVGPHAVNLAMATQLVTKDVPRVERRLINAIWKAHATEDEPDLDRSWECTKYNYVCPYIDKCFGTSPPTKASLIPRTPHHIYELEQMVRRTK